MMKHKKSSLQYLSGVSFQKTRGKPEFFPGDLFRWSLFCRCGYPVPFLWNYIIMGAGCGRIDICADAVIRREFVYG